MSNGKHRYDSGRARMARFRDREQSSFDEDLILSFLDELHDEWSDQRSRLPVRFGAKRLADHLSDSTLAAAILHSGDLDEPVDDDQSLAVDCHFPQTLFDMDMTESPIDETKQTPETPTAVPQNSDQSFSVWGVAQGFMIGAAATVVLLLIAGMLS